MRIKLISILGFLTIILCVLFSATGKNDGGPPDNTNAPNEKTCSGGEGTSACHGGGNADNSGPGTPSIIFDNGKNTYEPGKTYRIRPRITHPSFIKFGFQIVSLRNSNNKYAGTVALLDTLRTRMQQPNWGNDQDRIYVMHRFAGTAPFTPNTGEWEYSWKAPSTNQGNISFYACFVAANNNNTNDKDDQTYFTKLTISPASIGIDTRDKLKVSLFPNPATDAIFLDSPVDLTHAGVKIIDLSGKIVSSFVVSSSNNLRFDISKLIPGIYFLQIGSTHNTSTLKFMKQ